MPVRFAYSQNSIKLVFKHDFFTLLSLAGRSPGMGGETLKWERETCFNQDRKMSLKDCGFPQSSAFPPRRFYQKIVRRLFFLVV